jgi:uncharacterized phage infection (PIP) family protein YhgE
MPNMEILSKLKSSRFFLIGLIIPLVFQIVYLSIAIPALNNGNNRMKDLRIAIVNEDAALGKQVSVKLLQVLPFKTQELPGLSASLDAMNEGDYNMVIHIAPDFTAGCRQGGAQVSYYINQSAPMLTKEIMEKTALNINQTLNENVFPVIKEALKQNSAQALGQTGLPENVLAQIGSNLNKALDSLKYNIIASDIQKVNNAEGFTRIILPIYIFLTYFVGCAIMTLLHTRVYKSLAAGFTRRKILLVQLVTNLVISAIIPCIVIGLAACFGIPLNTGIAPAWLMLSTGFFTLLCLVQMFANWFGIPGMGLAVLVLFPLQIVTCGMIYPREILPSFYRIIGDYLPSTYFGNGILRLLFGGPSIGGEIGILLLMAVIFLIVSGLTILKRGRSSAESGVKSL